MKAIKFFIFSPHLKILSNWSKQQQTYMKNTFHQGYVGFVFGLGLLIDTSGMGKIWRSSQKLIRCPLSFLCKWGGQPSQYSLVQSYRWKHQNNVHVKYTHVWKMVNSRDTRRTSLMLFCYFVCFEQLSRIVLVVFLVHLKRVNAGLTV